MTGDYELASVGARWLGIAGLAFGSLALFLVANFAARKGAVGAEEARKAVHVLGSCIAAALPWLVEVGVLIPAACLLAALIHVADSRGRMSALTEERPIRGALWFLIAFALLLGLGVDRMAVAVGFVVLGTADASAAIVGARYGRNRIVPGLGRTWVGTAAFALVASAVVGAFGVALSIPWPTILVSAVSVSLATAAAEAISPSELDNLAIPIVAAALFHVEQAWGAERAWLHVFELAFTVGFVETARRKRWLTGDGCLAVVLFGIVPFAAAGWKAVAVLFLCFAIIIVLTKLRPECAVQDDIKGRNARQIAAFSAIPALGAVSFAGTGSAASLALIGVVAATAAADAWATEIGRLSRAEPISIVSGRRVPRGTSGGVTLLGLAASAAGGFLLSALAAVAGIVPAPHVLAIGAIATLAATFDSVLGATLQAKYECAQCGALAETPPSCHARPRLAKGQRWVSNEAVNLLASAFAAALYWVWAVH